MWQWTHGARDPEHVDPDLPALDTLGFDRPGNRDMQVGLFYDYRRNLDKYPAFQQYFRGHQPPTLIVWGQNNKMFGPTAPAPTSGTCPPPSCTCSTPVTSRSRKKATSSPSGQTS